MDPSTNAPAQQPPPSQLLEKQLEAAQARLTALDEQVTRFIRANPGACLLGALAVGFVIGRLASRR